MPLSHPDAPDRPTHDLSPASIFEAEGDHIPREALPEGFNLSADEAGALCDENTIGGFGGLGSTVDGSYEPVVDIAAALDKLQEDSGLDVPLRVVVRRGFSHDTADMLVADLQRQLPRLERRPEPVYDGETGTGLSH